MNIFKKIYQLYYKPKIFFPKKTYSMFGEDLIINNFFKKKTNGIYIDIGCYHPYDGSNTHLLFKKGWNGINIDLSELSIELFNVTRKNDLNLRLGVGAKNGKIKFFYRKKINMLNTTDEKHAKQYFLNGYQTSILKQKTLNRILEQSKYKNSKIDFLNIDAENTEYQILKKFNFKKYDPKLICIEIHGQNVNLPVYKLLTKQKYKKIWQKDYSYIFKKF
jgi:hypothetical protein